MTVNFDSFVKTDDIAGIKSFLYELCEKLNVAFEQLENTIGLVSSFAPDGVARTHGVCVENGEAEINSGGEINCRSLKTGLLSAYSSAKVGQLDAQALSLSNGSAAGENGIELKLLWKAASVSEYKTTGQTIQNVPDTDKFRIFFVRLSTENDSNEINTYIPCIRMGSYIRGMTGHPAEGEVYNYYCSFTANGEQLTVNAVKAHYPQRNTYTDRKVTKIYGII